MALTNSIEFLMWLGVCTTHSPSCPARYWDRRWWEWAGPFRSHIQRSSTSKWPACPQIHHYALPFPTSSWGTLKKWLCWGWPTSPSADFAMWMTLHHLALGGGGCKQQCHLVYHLVVKDFQPCNIYDVYVVTTIAMEWWFAVEGFLASWNKYYHGTVVTGWAQSV